MAHARGSRLRRLFGGALVVMLLAAAAPAAEEPKPLVKNGDAEAGTVENWTGLSGVVSEGAHSGKHSFFSTKAATIRSKELIPVSPDKVYTLTGWFKSAGKEKSLVYLGYVPFDEKKRQISPAHVGVLVGTDTTLAEACKKDDKVLKVADASKWKPQPYGTVAFNTDATGKYADLPNRNITSYGIVKVEKKEGHWEVHLKKKCNRAYPAGTNIRLHKSGGSYIYNAAGRRPAPKDKWQAFTGRILGEALQGAPSNRFWHGTRFVQILILSNYGQKKDVRMLVDDISVTESEKPKPKAKGSAPKTR